MTSQESTHYTLLELDNAELHGFPNLCASFELWHYTATYVYKMTEYICWNKKEEKFFTVQTEKVPFHRNAERILKQQHTYRRS